VTTQELRAFLGYVQTKTGRWGQGAVSSKKPASMSTVDAYWRTLQALFSWLVREGLIINGENPLSKIPRPKVPVKVIQDIPFKMIREAMALFDARTLVGARNIAILLLLVDTGIRLSECSGLTFDDLNLSNGTARVWGKGGKQRIVPISQVVKKALKRYITLMPEPNGKLWVDRHGKPINKRGIQTFIRRLKKLGGNVRWSPHTFRNTFAVNYLRGGGDPFTLQILGGWEDLEMPRHYAASLRAEDAFRVHRKASPAKNLMSSRLGRKPSKRGRKN
jgi:site-specific recombinase XerD